MFLITESRSDIDIGFIIGVARYRQFVFELYIWMVNTTKLLTQPGTRFGIVISDRFQRTRVSLKFSESIDPLSVRQALEDLYVNYGPYANISAALYVARTQLFNETNGDREDAPNLAVLITDGTANIDRGNTIPYAQDLHRDGIRVVCIGIKSNRRISKYSFFLKNSPKHVVLGRFSLLPCITGSLN